MRKLFGLLSAAVFMATAAAPAGAASLEATGQVFGVAIGALPPITISGASVAPVFVSSGGGSWANAGQVFGPATINLPTQLFTGVSLISSLNVVGAGLTLGTQAAGAGLGGGFGGTAPVAGTAVVGVLGGLINLFIPLSPVGQTGAPLPGGAASLLITVTGHLWTTGVGAVTAVTTGTPTVNTLNMTGFDNRTAGHQGSILLVSPFRALTNAAGNLPGFATALLTFVPEPGTLLLIGTGVAGIALIGRKKLHK